jgi:hypothetical protein
MTDKLVYSAVAIPGEPDYDGEILTESEIQYAAHKFMSDYRVIDPEHVCALTNECINVGNPVESTILREPMIVKSIHDGNEMTLPKGTWILGIEVTDPNEWERIVTGEATGLSLTAGRTTLKSRVLIRDLGKNWEVKTVSIVRDPAVPKAKFFQIGRSGMMNDEATKSRFQSFFDKIEEAVKSFKQEETFEAEPTVEETDVEPAVETEDSIKSETEEEIVAEPEQEPQEQEDDEVIVEEESSDETSEEETEQEAVKFVTAEELQSAKEEILEAVKTLMQPATEDEAVKSDPEEEEEEEEEAAKDDEDLDEIRRKDIKIQELEKKILDLEAKLESANKSRSKGIPPHFVERKAVKNLYIDDNRDLYGRVIR